MVRSCYKLMDALDDEQLRQELSSAPDEIAKQINLYAMMHYNRIPQLIDAPAGYVTTDRFPYNEYMVHPMNTYVKTK